MPQDAELYAQAMSMISTKKASAGGSHHDNS